MTTQARPAVRRVVTATGSVAILTIGILGGLQAVGARLSPAGIVPGGPLAPFSLDAEGNLPALFSAGLLLWVALLALFLGALRLDGRSAIPWVGIGILFAVMAADEWTSIHERLEQRTGIDWQTLYLPVFAVGGLAWLAIVRRVGAYRPARALLIAGAAAWVVAQALENLQWVGDRPVALYKPMAVAEEVLEMSGSFLFGLALLTVLLAVFSPVHAAPETGSPLESSPDP